jgi:spore germination cell wall hydrolase CwlJ-like protein
MFKPFDTISEPPTPARKPGCKNNEPDDHADTLARTIYGDARGETLDGMEAVANVILNRYEIARRHENGYWWGSTIKDICLRPAQFSCWNKNDPNRLVMERVSSDNPIFAICQRIARRSVAGVLRDNTHGATHYHARQIMPDWAMDEIPVAKIGHHIFYRLVK